MSREEECEGILRKEGGGREKFYEMGRRNGECQCELDLPVGRASSKSGLPVKQRDDGS